MDIDLEKTAISRAKAGDTDAWKYLFEQHFQAAWGFCLQLTGGRKDAAEEICQQVFVTASGIIHKFRDDRGTFRSWLYGIARKHYAKFKTKEARRKLHEQKSSENKSTAMVREDNDLRVYETLAKLPVHYRSVLEAKYFEKLTVNEIAESLDKTPKAVESLLGRARQRFSVIYSELT